MAAIYMWFNPGEEVTLTTTLYPVEAADGLNHSISFVGFGMSAPHDETMDMAIGFVSGLLEALLLEYGPDDEALDMSIGFVSGLLEDILIEYGPDDEAMDMSIGFVSGLLDQLLVETYAPDEALEMSIALNSFTMTPV